MDARRLTTLPSNPTRWPCAPYARRPIDRSRSRHPSYDALCCLRDPARRPVAVWGRSRGGREARGRRRRQRGTGQFAPAAAATRKRAAWAYPSKVESDWLIRLWKPFKVVGFRAGPVAAAADGPGNGEEEYFASNLNPDFLCCRC